MERPTLFFDGDCPRCCRQAAWLQGRRRGPLFSVQPLPSPGESLLLEHLGKTYTKSSAVLQAAILLGFPWVLLAVFLLIPRPLRDWAYDRYAARRPRVEGSS